MFSVGALDLGVVIHPDLERVPGWESLLRWDDPWPSEITIWYEHVSATVSASAEFQLPNA